MLKNRKKRNEVKVRIVTELRKGVGKSEAEKKSRYVLRRSHGKESESVVADAQRTTAHYDTCPLPSTNHISEQCVGAVPRSVHLRWHLVAGGFKPATSQTCQVP